MSGPWLPVGDYLNVERGQQQRQQQQEARLTGTYGGGAGDQVHRARPCPGRHRGRHRPGVLGHAQHGGFCDVGGFE